MFFLLQNWGHTLPFACKNTAHSYQCKYYAWVKDTHGSLGFQNWVKTLKQLLNSWLVC